jgi:hypothetical protein
MANVEDPEQDHNRCIERAPMGGDRIPIAVMVTRTTAKTPTKTPNVSMHCGDEEGNVGHDWIVLA